MPSLRSFGSRGCDFDVEVVDFVDAAVYQSKVFTGFVTAARFTIGTLDRWVKPVAQVPQTDV